MLSLRTRRQVVSVAFLAAATLFAAAPARADPRASLERVDALFDGYFAWFGSMYDRHGGGAYYSPVSRANPHQYPPHIESTSKYVRVIEWSDLVGQTPGAVRSAIVDGYLKPRQIGDPGHAYAGFFLDPAYSNLDPADDGADVSDTAAARALQFSVDTLAVFGESPDHPLPEVSQGGLSHLQSGAAFTAWLADRRWDRTWTAGGDILAQAGNIKLLGPAKRREVLDAAWAYLENEQQDPATGQWGDLDQGDNRRPYVLLNGAHKIASFYTEFGRPVPHAEALLDVALAEVQGHRPNNLLHVYNVSQLVKNLTTASGATIGDAELTDFVRREAEYLAQFRQDDGGFSGTLGGANASVFQPAIDGPVSNTDVGGLALRARDTLHDLVTGSHQPLKAASDPRLFGLSGANSRAIVSYDFAGRSRAPERAATVAASDFGDADSYRHFSVTPRQGNVSLYFLALTVSNGGAGVDGRVLVKFAVGDDPTDADFVEAGSTTIPGGGESPVTRDVPLLTFDALQDLNRTVTFRIYGNAFADDGGTFQLDAVRLFAATAGDRPLP